jgi:biopolymer transport protein ExbB/TolQ
MTIKTEKEEKIRSVAEPLSAAAKHRQKIYKSAFIRLNEANKAGFYLEAITLIESLISDRLESRLSYLDKKDFSFKTLGKLIQKSKVLENDQTMTSLVLEELPQWAKGRNSALHEMAKIEQGDTSSWPERYARLKLVADSGLKLLRKIDRQSTKLRNASFED